MRHRHRESKAWFFITGNWFPKPSPLVSKPRLETKWFLFNSKPLGTGFQLTEDGIPSPVAMSPRVSPRDCDRKQWIPLYSRWFFIYLKTGFNYESETGFQLTEDG
jgi:hypothetical protein